MIRRGVSPASLVIFRRRLHAFSRSAAHYPSAAPAIVDRRSRVHFRERRTILHAATLRQRHFPPDRASFLHATFVRHAPGLAAVARSSQPNRRSPFDVGTTKGLSRLRRRRQSSRG